LIALLLVAGSAFAWHCPSEMKKIDDALAKNPKLTPEQLAEVKKDRADGDPAQGRQASGSARHPGESRKDPRRPDELTPVGAPVRHRAGAAAPSSDARSPLLFRCRSIFQEGPTTATRRRVRGA